MEDFKYVRTNITSLRMVDPGSQEVQNVVQDWIFGEMRKGRVLTLTAQEVTVILNFVPMIDSLIIKKKCLDRRRFDVRRRPLICTRAS